MLEFPNLEERVAVLNRLMDILTVSMAVSLLMEIIQAFFSWPHLPFPFCCLRAFQMLGSGPCSLLPFNNDVVSKCHGVAS